jgi:hypothetical protein
MSSRGIDVTLIHSIMIDGIRQGRVSSVSRNEFDDNAATGSSQLDRDSPYFHNNVGTALSGSPAVR